MQAPLAENEERAPTPDDLTERNEEREAIEDAAALSPRLIFESIRLSGEEELERPKRALWYAGIAAGILISFSVLGEAHLRPAPPSPTSATTPPAWPPSKA